MDVDVEDGPTPSSASDFYNNNTPAESTEVSAPAEASAMETNGQTDHAKHQDAEPESDSSSDMDTDSSQSSSPEPEEPESQNQEPLPEQEQPESQEPMPDPEQPESQEPMPMPESHLAYRKRKLGDGDDVTNDELQTAEEPSKKVKRAAPLQPADGPPIKPGDKMPVEYWQHIFLYLPPAALGRCLSVCRDFNTYLTNTKADTTKKFHPEDVRRLDSEMIWAQARKNFHMLNLPRPLAGYSELQMFQLIGGATCQFCKQTGLPLTPRSPYDSGPGEFGLRVIWPFGFRTCGSCLLDYTLKDTDVLQSAAAPLRMGLAYAYVTQDQHFVPEMYQASGGIPTHLRLSRIYFTPDMTNIMDEYTDVKSYGAGTEDEWKKGLQNKGKEKMADASRWEKWEAQLEPSRSLRLQFREYDPVSFPHFLNEVRRESHKEFPRDQELLQAGPPPKVTQPPAVANGANLPPKPVQSFQNGSGTPAPQLSNMQYQQVHRPVRDAREVERIRQERRVEIERRAMELEPPVPANVLQQMDAFRNAMQITQPMTDAAWPYLRDKILEQREKAEEIERQREETMAVMAAASTEHIEDSLFLKPAREVYDKEYEDAQAGLRQKLGEYAQEYIDTQWNGATALNKDKCPEFAAYAIMYVAKRYAEDKQRGLLPKFAPPAKGNSAQGAPMPEPFLSLDNMKWVFDNKIRDLTDPHRRELFICQECHEERKPKWFAFEGLIQHFGAKHTSSFGRANVIVVWQLAEWPDPPPFHTDPSYYVKIAQKPNDYKGHGRQRNTPQNGRQGPFSMPDNGNLATNPYFSTPSQQPQQAYNGYYNAGAAAHQYSQPSQQYGAYGYQYQTAPLAPTQDVSFASQVHEVAIDARDVWDSLANIQNLLECIRVYTMIHHVVARFKGRHFQMPSLDHLDLALANEDLMIRIKNAHGLACKICVANQTGGAGSLEYYYDRIAKVKKLNISSLVTHFKISHLATDNGRLDWATDMIELPEKEIIEVLIRTPGMTDLKLALIAAAFPTALPKPLPQIGTVKEPSPPRQRVETGASKLVDKMFKKTKPTEAKKKRKQSKSTTPEPKEDEYDPRRPMTIEEDVLDPARFDTDVARRSSAAAPQQVGGLNLAPQTITALQNFTAMVGNGANQTRMERSPSAGQETRPVVAPPDISAILATLTGQGHHTPAPPTMTPARTSATGPYAAPPPTYHPPPPPGAYFAPSPTYPDPPSHPTGGPADHALAHNARTHEANHAARSPPRYTYFYEQAAPAYSQPPPPPPQQVVYDTPVSYMYVPPGSGSGAQPLYTVDEWGRPIALRPIGAAPTPPQQQQRGGWR